MENTFLPGTVRQRLADLMKYHKVSQTDLALKIGCGDSLLSRFLTGKTDKIGDENIIRIARVFNVSTDFLLGVTNVPDRKNYEIDELGLSAQAARKRYLFCYPLWSYRTSFPHSSDKSTNQKLSCRKLWMRHRLCSIV